MSYRIVKNISVLEKNVVIECYNTGNGINVLLEGGDKGHIGVIAVLSADMPLQLITFPTHKETVVCKRWAEVLFEKFQAPVVVEAGIHYDNIGKSEISHILERLEEELFILINDMEKEEYTDV